MAATSGTENLALVRSSVEDRLFAEPYCFDFVQAVRLLRQFYPHRSCVGLFESPGERSSSIQCSCFANVSRKSTARAKRARGRGPGDAGQFHGDHRAAWSAAAVLHRTRRRPAEGERRDSPRLPGYFSSPDHLACSIALGRSIGFRWDLSRTRRTIFLSICWISSASVRQACRIASEYRISRCCFMPVCWPSSLEAPRD